MHPAERGGFNDGKNDERCRGTCGELAVRLSGTNNNAYVTLAAPCDLSVMEDLTYTPEMLRETPEYNRLVEASKCLGIELCCS